eukprot:450149_1
MISYLKSPQMQSPILQQSHSQSNSQTPPPLELNDKTNSDYLYLFEASKQIVTMTTGTCLYDIEEYGIIAEIMGCSKQQEKASGVQILSTQPSLSSITSMSMVDHVLSRLRQNHDRNKAS